MQKVLMIDDERTMREAFAELVKTRYEVRSAENGTTGIQVAREWLPDIIICDLSMPDMTGYEVLENLRKNTETSFIPFIFLTAHSEKAAQRKGMHLGADDYLTKPCTATELFDTIETRLSRNASLSEARKHFRQSSLLDPATQYLTLRAARQGWTSSQNKQTTMILVSPDRLRKVLDMLGSEDSAALLATIADRIRKALDKDFTLARAAEDEFLILLPYSSKPDVTEICALLHKECSKPLGIGAYELQFAFSIVACTSRAGVNFDDQLKFVRFILRDTRGLSTFVIHDYDPQKRVSARLDIETRLRQGIQRNELKLFYQPKVNAQTGLITGGEALIRWHNSDRYIPPKEFFAVAEEAGLSKEIDFWVANETARQISCWLNEFPTLEISFNLSAEGFHNVDFGSKLQSCISEHGISPSSLQVEIVESTVIQDYEEAKNRIVRLRDSGHRVALDDFGTGYSSLRHLHTLPFDVLKIDRDFIQGLQKKENRIITNSVIHLAHKLGYEIVAEGVETRAQRNYLATKHCDLIQGYYYSPPVPPAVFETLLRQQSL